MKNDFNSLYCEKRKFELGMEWVRGKHAQLLSHGDRAMPYFQSNKYDQVYEIYLNNLTAFAEYEESLAPAQPTPIPQAVNAPAPEETERLERI